MAERIRIFEKNKADFGLDGVSASASEASDLAIQVLNRSNLNAWITTGSLDANNTTLTIEMTDPKDVSDILLIKHNFKSFRVEYWNGSAYQNFAKLVGGGAVYETTNTNDVSYYRVTKVSTSRIRITIYGTMTANDDKELRQAIFTELISQLEGWPQIRKPTHSRNRKRNTMLSGKQSIAENVGAFSCDFSVKEWKKQSDIETVERLYNMSEGFLVWLCGGDEDQFWMPIQGYRKEDVYLMKCADEYEPQFPQGMYQRGLEITMKLTEVVD